MTRVYIRTFTSPLLALAFKDGVELGDNLGFFKVEEPKLDKPNNWIVRVEDHTDDDEDDEEESGKIIEMVEPRVIRKIEARDRTTSKKVLRPDFVKATPITPRLKDINTPAIQSAVEVKPNTTDPCPCWNCKAGSGECLTELNNAIAMMNGRER